jgi:putative transposase
MRRDKFAPGEYFHIFNRGNNKQNIFSGQKDWARLLFLILYFQSPVNFNNLGRQTSFFVKHRVFNIFDAVRKEVIEKRYVELISFALMPNHFHLILHELEKDGISRFMQRILNAYAKYFNAKYDKVGHLFQGPYKAVHIENNEQLLYLSTYIHRNPREIKDWRNREADYPWSSYQDYIIENRWDKLLMTDIITNQFSNKQEYRNFTKTSPAKDFLNKDLTIDDNI